MKVLIVTPYPSEKNKIKGGVEASAVYLLEGLKKIKDLYLSVLTWKKGLKKEMCIIRDEIKIYCVPLMERVGNITLGMMNKYKLKQKIKEIKPDIVHFQNHPNYVYLCWKSDFPCVTTVHGIIHREVVFEKGVVNFFRKFFRIYLEKLSLKKNTHIICVSPYSVEVVRKVTKAEIYFVPNPVSESFFQINDSGEDGRILCAAPISRLKNMLGLFEVVNVLKEKKVSVKLIIAGEVRDGDYFKELMQYRKKYNLEDYIEYVGHLSERELIEEYKKCCMLVLMSFQENSPMVIQQAMAAGKPVVATKVGGIPYLVKEGKTGFSVEGGDIKSFAGKIKLLLENKLLRREFGENGRREALRRFKPEIIAKRTYEIYQRIINNSL